MQSRFPTGGRTWDQYVRKLYVAIRGEQVQRVPELVRVGAGSVWRKRHGCRELAPVMRIGIMAADSVCS